MADIGRNSSDSIDQNSKHLNIQEVYRLGALVLMRPIFLDEINKTMTIKELLYEPKSQYIAYYQTKEKVLNINYHVMLRRRAV